MSRGRVGAEVRGLLASRPVFLDTETTGLEAWDEVCELAVVAADGTVLMDTLVRPTIAIPREASAVHGISNELVVAAPPFPDLWPELRRLLSGRTVVSYNAEFDLRMLNQSSSKHGVRLEWPTAEQPQWVCAMKLFARFNGEWNERHGNWRWLNLRDAAFRCGIPLPPGLHRARVDAELTRRIIHHLARFG